MSTLKTAASFVLADADFQRTGHSTTQILVALRPCCTTVLNMLLRLGGITEMLRSREC